MSVILKNMYLGYRKVLDEYSDPRTKDWFLMSDPWQIIGIVAFYHYFCTNLGPRLMENRKPFQLRMVIMLYNIFQIAYSLLLVYEGNWFIWTKRDTLSCIEIDQGFTPTAVRTASDMWLYFFAKVTELADTVFFVLKKNNRQISFLHVYHHSLMVLGTWTATKFTAGGHAVILGWLNAYVHVVMYSYYLIAGLGPQYQKYLWWKKYVTIMQLVQFGIILVHNLVALLSPSCSYPKVTNFICCVNAIFFVYLFGSFYYVNYIKNAKREKKVKEIEATKTNEQDAILDKDAANVDEVTTKDDMSNGAIPNAKANGVFTNEVLTNRALRNEKEKHQ